ncbi:Structural maintenance of chromosomes protein 5 [Golovinomyces cichoracearum]|uniref:Structural maintenance of chromosomes protein 5 n=1 Tax=Golovinomyces cichoracearum TaxID=62708 RepID=A0A420IKG9_9PEZI|nr:Structural maintenance of chromosomes protein 5 [Golovinomyces cichoracearum]
MPSTMLVPSSERKRARSISESERDDAEITSIRSKESLTPNRNHNKRVKTKVSHSNSHSFVQQTPTQSSNHFQTEITGNNGEDSISKFQHGAIVWVKVANFVTYEKAEFYPGPSLNMVIGPNGTGKSSLVCAICLGLGSSPAQLGRATQVGEFVKHNMPEAVIEIALQGPEGKNNYVIRSQIIREDNSRQWWLNGKRSHLKAVKLLVEKLSIQIDNLCQFLPQEKVAEFSALSPSELLIQTQRAAAPPDLLEKHEELKRLRKAEVALEIRNEATAQELKTHEIRQQNLEAQVQKLHERNKIQENIALLRKKIPFVEYKLAIAKHNSSKAQKLAAHKLYEELEARIAPTLLSIEQKKSHVEQIDSIVRSRKAALISIERECQQFNVAYEKLTDEISGIEVNLTSEIDQEKNTKLKIVKCQKNISNWQKQIESRAPVFNASEWNQRIRVKEQESRELRSKLADKKSELDELHARGRATRQNIDEAHTELRLFDSQEGQLMNKLEQQSRDTANAWKWIQEHQSDFEKEVYGPPLLTCSMKTKQYTREVESLIGRNDMVTISVQTKSDFKRLSDQLNGTMRLTDITIKQVDHQAVPTARPLSTQDMQRYGMMGWAIDQIDGPDAVRAMLCDSARLDRSAIALHDITEDNYQTILREEKLNIWVTRNQRFVVTRRKEYGPGAVSTIARPVLPERFWTNQPIDASARAEIEQRIDNLETEFRTLKQQNDSLKSSINELRTQDSTIQDEIKDIQREKAKLQEIDKEFRSLPERIKQEEVNLLKAREKLLEHRETSKEIQNQHDNAVIKKASSAIAFKDHISKARSAHDELLEAQIRFIEADSDVTSLIELNSSIVQQRDEELKKLRDIDEEAKKVKAIASKALKTCKALLADPENEPFTEQLAQQDEDTTIESLEIEIAAEESKLEFLIADNPNAIEQFAARQEKVQKLTTLIEETCRKLQKVNKKILKVRSEWEPALDKLIQTISNAFSFNFEQIGCAGEVSIHKDDDFEKWAIQIKVKFRENETLQILDQHRQSGGERSVSTIFYLMALQSLATSPFRVVDEINQGMDPRNERVVHERIVKIACEEYTSQYFLITPKLLTGLRYDPRMKILCIISGKHLPEDDTLLSIPRIIAMKKAISASR